MLSRERMRGGVAPLRCLCAALVAVCVAAVVVSLDFACGKAEGLPHEGTAAARPTLVVMLVVDQMRADYLSKYGHQWKGGLRRLIEGGAWFQQAVYPYVSTVTCVGHATISTGTFPRTHGIIGNSWWDRASGKTVECADDPDAYAISYGKPVNGGRSPARLLVATFTDRLRATASVAPRVVTFSMKERTAIMLAGHGATAATWYDAPAGTLVTSSAYASARVPFVERFLAAHPIEKDLDTAWRPRQAPRFYLYSDEAAGERPPAFWTASFPHPLRREGMQPGQSYEAWEESPFSDAYLARLGEAAIDSLGLGKGPGTDYLGISFSALDLVGHDFGPRSHEVQDVLLHLDDALGSLLAALDRKVGPDRYVVALAADHGVSPIPEQAVAEGLAAGRIASATVTAAVARIEEAFKPVLDGAPGVARLLGGQVYLTAPGRDALAHDVRIREAILGALSAVPGVARVLITDERARWDGNDPIARAVGYNFFPGRSGDVVAVQKPYWLLGSGSAASHGTPYRYDAWVPLFLYGSAIRPGHYTRPVTPADVAPTLAWLSGTTMPQTDGRPLLEAMK